MASRFVLFFHLILALMPLSDGRELQGACNSCVPKIPFDATRHKGKYTVGVLNFQGPESAFNQYNDTFNGFLTATAGQQFEPPIEFQMIPLGFQSMFDLATNSTFDFLFVSPSPFSCVEAQYGAQSLVTQISKRVVGNETYDLEEFGGVIAVRADNHEINTIQDLKGKVIGAAAISSFGGGQMQFREMQNAGLSYINDPKQLVFTGDQGAIVNGVINGNFDVGFVRTDQIERTKDADGLPIDRSLLKVLQPQNDTINGVPFPFTASTRLYPEWNLAAMKYVSEDVSAQVQAAMLALKQHSMAGLARSECLAGSTNITDGSLCNNIKAIFPDARCDTTPEIADIALSATTNGQYAGFRTTLSYIDIRAMLQDTSFISLNEATKTWQCVRPDLLYGAIICPPGHFKKPEDKVMHGCQDEGLECGNGYTCVCTPCIKAYDVSVEPDESSLSGNFPGGCAKMTVCGTTQQRQPLLFKAVDNEKRHGNMTVVVQDGEYNTTVPVKHLSQDDVFEFSIVSDHVGIMILEISLDGEQVPQSPLRVLVERRDCHNHRLEADANGECVCVSNMILIAGTCVPLAIFVPVVLAPVFIVLFVWMYFYIQKKAKEADSVWHLSFSDLKFGEPAEIIGSGSFGLVLLAEYRGTKVAVKRALPPKQQSLDTNRSSSIGTASSRVCFTGDGRSPGVYDTKTHHSGENPSNSVAMQSIDEVLTKLEEGNVESPKPAEITDSNSGASAENTSESEGTITKDTQSKRTTSTKTTASSQSSRSGVLNRFLLKKRSATSSSAQEKEKFIREMRLLSKLRHPCITTVMGAVIEKGKDPLLVMEYMNHGSLHDIIHNETMALDGEIVLNILRDIAQGIRFLHCATPPIVHGDLKSANVLVDSNFKAKVADFGLALQQPGSARGTPYWMAPELLRGESSNSPASDMYSIGIILYELYSRKDPYEGEDTERTIRHICDKKKKKRPPVPRGFPPKIAKLMKFLLQDDPSLRPTAEVFDNRVSELEPNDAEPSYDGPTSRRKKDKGDNGMLYRVFPPHIADVLQRGGKVEPESHENVTIFFSDIVRFTDIASALTPLKVSDLLDRLYHGLDRLVRQYDVFKIETIGDAYMCAGNLVKDQNMDHVKRVAEFALAAVDEASKTPIDLDNPSLGNVEIRVGFHSGPVVSNVVGSLNPRYGLFGDTVNVANRMESTSEPGKIHCSERSAMLLLKQAPKMLLSTRGRINVKGKGEMKTFWLHQPRVRPSPGA